MHWQFTCFISVQEEETLHCKTMATGKQPSLKTHIPTQIQTYTQKYWHTHIHTQIQTYTYTHTNKYTYTHKYRHTHIHTQIKTYTHKYTHRLWEANKVKDCGQYRNNRFADCSDTVVMRQATKSKNKKMMKKWLTCRWWRWVGRQSPAEPSGCRSLVVNTAADWLHRLSLPGSAHATNKTHNKRINHLITIASYRVNHRG